MTLNTAIDQLKYDSISNAIVFNVNGFIEN